MLFIFVLSLRGDP